LFTPWAKLFAPLAKLFELYVLPLEQPIISNTCQPETTTSTRATTKSFLQLRQPTTNNQQKQQQQQQQQEQEQQRYLMEFEGDYEEFGDECVGRISCGLIL
jgi:hypothetical protein